jgi:hypothetical protein
MAPCFTSVSYRSSRSSMIFLHQLLGCSSELISGAQIRHLNSSSQFYEPLKYQRGLTATMHRLRGIVSRHQSGCEAIHCQYTAVGATAGGRAKFLAAVLVVLVDVSGGAVDAVAVDIISTVRQRGFNFSRYTYESILHDRGNR